MSVANERIRVMQALRAAAPVPVAPKLAKRVVARATAANVRFLTRDEHRKVIADRRAKTAAAAATAKAGE